MEKHNLYKRIILLFLGFLFILTQGRAENGLTFEAGSTVFAGIRMPYRFARTAMGADKPALVVYLHGGSSKGNDNETQMTEAGIDSIGWTHEMTCIQSYTTPRLDWVFAHRRIPTGIGAVESPASATEQVQFYSPDGRRLPSKPTKGLYIERRRLRDGAVVTVKRMR